MKIEREHLLLFVSVVILVVVFATCTGCATMSGAPKVLVRNEHFVPISVSTASPTKNLSVEASNIAPGTVAEIDTPISWSGNTVVFAHWQAGDTKVSSKPFMVSQNCLYGYCGSHRFPLVISVDARSQHKAPRPEGHDACVSGKGRRHYGGPRYYIPRTHYYGGHRNFCY